jgi:hypothetical protein
MKMMTMSTSAGAGSLAVSVIVWMGFMLGLNAVQRIEMSPEIGDRGQGTGDTLNLVAA